MRLRLLGLLAVLVAPLLTPPPAAATVWPAGTLQLEGRGFGHGRGLSQYGAQAQARAGKTHQQILTFYYPGTTTTAPVRNVRVLISADTVDTVVLAQTGLRFRDLSTGAVTTLPANGATQWKLHPNTSKGKVQLSWYDGAWRSYKLLAGNGEFFGSSPLTLVLPGEVKRGYRATLRHVAELSSSKTVNELPMDSYVRGVVPREMPSSWLPAALRAQAVAARTFATHDLLDHPTRAWQLCDTTQCQVYGGVGAETTSTNQAVVATANQVLMYGGAPAYTQFSSSNGGWTVSGAEPYLPSKQDPYDPYNTNPPWTTAKSTSLLAKAHPEIGTLKSVEVIQRDGHGTWGGRVLKLRLHGSVKAVDIPGTEVRTLWGLKSTWFRFV